MTSTTFFFVFIPLLAIILLAVNLIFAPHNPYQEKDSAFECGFHSFLGQNRTQFSISFFIFALLFLLFDLEILLVYPYVVSAYTNDVYGLTIMLIFFLALTLGFAFELGKNALKIDSRQMNFLTNKSLNITTCVSSVFGGLCSLSNAYNFSISYASKLHFSTSRSLSSPLPSPSPSPSQEDDGSNNTDDESNSDGEGSSSGDGDDDYDLFHAPVNEIPEDKLEEFIKTLKDFVHHPVEIGNHHDTPDTVERRQECYDRLKELESKDRENRGVSSNSDSESDSSCDTCGTPRHSGQDVPSNPIPPATDASTVADTEAGIGTSVDSDVASSSSNKRKFEADSESSTQRDPDYQDSSDINADTEPMDYG